MSYPQPPSIWIFSGITHFSSAVQKLSRFGNDSKDELKEHLNKKDCLLQSKDSYNYSIEQHKDDSGIVSAYSI